MKKKLKIPFTTQPELKSVDIMVIRDAKGVEEHHGLIVIRPDAGAEWFIKHVKGQRLRNKLVAARQFVERTSHKEVFSAEDDRRRGALEVSKINEPQVAAEGMEQFFIQH
ncbi:hypothetical protein BOW51_02905 [Solemya velesiana gill symbiont]|uniref:Uncharacterized protein n=2 Tax=Solemya velesiana gill symbiont TaxID=1918948 RepID=A0A1T2KWX0_9GAMM|nr:hypothetical protein BOW51_02905 [Solemya velesiana gill symbiont]